ncbi:MAG: ATP-dependent protease ATPase subunit HslU [Phycisphaeraceae bacterium]
MQNLTPKQIVAELDKYIIGQADAKRAVAVAIRNRWRRRNLQGPMANEVYPKNIIMIGPTGVGKTEIARRLATLTGAPFVKVEASKYTEVGYHGRDVESMIRDLLDNAISMVRTEQAEKVAQRADELATDRLMDLLLPAPASSRTVAAHANDDETSAPGSEGGVGHAGYVATDESDEARQRVRQRLRDQLTAGKLDDREVELTITSKPQAGIMFAGMGMDQMDPEMSNVLERLMPEQSKRRRVKVSEAKRLLVEQETDKLLDRDKIVAEAITRTQESGMIFLDEIDKVASPSGDGSGGGRGPDVSRQGVQRDLLPIVEGSAVTTRYGVVHSDHILFIAAGAFHSSAVSDLMPELQGRFPIRVELSPLTRDDFVRILTEPKNALTRQQEQLLGVEGLTVTFADGAIEALADYAAQANASMENIGARRLMTIIEKVFEDVNFDAPEMVQRHETSVTITAQFVAQRVASIVKDQDLSRFVL